MHINQRRLFDEEPSTSVSTQGTFLSSLEQWRTLMRRNIDLSYEGGGANAQGFIDELSVLAKLCRLAMPDVGVLIEQWYTIDGMKADFFLSGLSAFPDGIAIEVRNHEGSGSHAKKLTDLAVAYDQARIPVLIVTVGSVIGSGVLQRLERFCQSSAYVKHMPVDKFYLWVSNTARTERKRRSAA